MNNESDFNVGMATCQDNPESFNQQTSGRLVYGLGGVFADLSAGPVALCSSHYLLYRLPSFGVSRGAGSSVRIGLTSERVCFNCCGRKSDSPRHALFESADPAQRVEVFF